MIIPMICDLHIAEFWIKDFSKEFSTRVALFIFYIVYLAVILFTAERTYKEVELLIINRENKKVTEKNRSIPPEIYCHSRH